MAPGKPGPAMAGWQRRQDGGRSESAELRSNVVKVDLETIRLFLHLLGASVWVGGQIVLMGLVPVARSAGPDVPRAVARRFEALSWPFFGLAVVTGLWNVMAENPSEHTTGWQIALMIKLLLVAATGVGAAVHSRTRSVPARAATAGVGFVAALAALFIGVALAH